MPATTIRLTDFANCAGCAGKVAPLRIRELLQGLPQRPDDPDFLVGVETTDDAGVYRLAPDLALVQTLDFFPPLVDDPFTFGQIAAANALSDVYAMNGRPLTVMNIAMFPDDVLPLSILAEILRGAADRVAAAGAVTVGGHTLRDKEIKFGLSVTGLAHPSEVLTNASAQPGDLLVLTKPLGTGFITTASKKNPDDCPPDVLARAVAGMTQLNALGRDALRASGGAHALTDVTGFGLAGHGGGLADGSGVTLEIDVAALPRIPGSEPLAIPPYFTRASHTNREYVESRLRIESTADSALAEYAFDAQTSGGLLIAVHPDHADALVHGLQLRGALASSVIGRVTHRQGTTALVLR